MEKDNEDKDSVKEHIRRLVKPIFDKSLKETISNHTMGGYGSSGVPVVYLWQPHNFRLYFDFSKVGFEPRKPSSKVLKEMKVRFSFFNSAYTSSSLNFGAEHIFKDFMFCTIRVKKFQVEVINHYHSKQWRKIVAVTLEDVDKRIDEVMGELKSRSVQALRSFIELHGGFSKFSVLKERCEHGIHGVDFLDGIKDHVIFDDTYAKKLYRYKPEVKDVASLKSIVSNDALNRFSPIICQELRDIKACVDEKYESIGVGLKGVESAFISVSDTLLPTIKDLGDNMKAHVSIMKGIERGISVLNERLETFPKEIKEEAFVSSRIIEGFTWKWVL